MPVLPPTQREGGKPERRSSPSLSGVLVDAGDELLTVPSPGHEGPLVVAILRCCPFGAEEMPAKFHVQNRAPGRLWSPTEPGSPLAWGLGTQPRGAGSRPLQAAGPGLIDSDPRDKVLRSLVVELGLNRADELPELWLGHHELDSQSDLPAGARLGRGPPTSPHQ
ncbi:cbp/p300-interacting transactivator 1-like [Molothrus aeneus]|uniref:cbp/p300-interacting transactivator 1-like n=1 Tax=Molothrus aeneus TaxID=84833 RepID=UPI003459F2AC